VECSVRTIECVQNPVWIAAMLQFAQLFRSSDLRGMRIAKSGSVFLEQFDHRTYTVLFRRAQILPARNEFRTDNDFGLQLIVIPSKEYSVEGMCPWSLRAWKGVDEGFLP
jgi:hypothetical protein